MPWTLKPKESIRDYVPTMKFYKVAADLTSWRDSQVLDHRKYRKWAMESCGSTWAITPPTKIYGIAGQKSYFYIGFESGEDKIGFRLAHDPAPCTMVEQNLKVFVREWNDK